MTEKYDNIDKNLLEAFNEDTRMDTDRFAEMAMEVTQLQSKYVGLWIKENRRLKGAERLLEALWLAKFKFLTEGPTEKTNALGWVLPDRGKIAKYDVEKYLLADPDIQRLKEEIVELQGRVDAYAYFKETLKYRQNYIENLFKYYQDRRG